MKRTAFIFPLIFAAVGFVVAVSVQLLRTVSFRWIWTVTLGAFVLGALFVWYASWGFKALVKQATREYLLALGVQKAGRTIFMGLKYDKSLLELAVRRASEQKLIRPLSRAIDIRYSLYELTDLGREVVEIMKAQ